MPANQNKKSPASPGSVLSQSMNLSQNQESSPEGGQGGDDGDDGSSSEDSSDDPLAGDDDFQLDEFDDNHPLNWEREETGQDDQGDPGSQGDDPSAKGEEPAKGDPEGNDKQRYQYWQSQHDKMKSELDEKDQTLNQTQQQIQTLQNQISQLSNSMQANGQPQPGGQESQQGQPTVDQQIEAKSAELKNLSEPTAPAKPSDYNESDAYTDPDSASFKYQRALEGYNQQRIEYLQKRQNVKDELNSLQLKQVSEPVQQTQRQMQMNQQEKMLFDNLQKSHNLSSQEAQDFIQTFSDPKSMQLENLVAYYKFQKGLANSSTSKPPQKQGGKPNRRQTVAAPPPAKGGSEGSGTDTSPDDEFTKGLLSGADMYS